MKKSKSKKPEERDKPDSPPGKPDKEPKPLGLNVMDLLVIGVDIVDIADPLRLAVHVADGIIILGYD